MKITPARLFSVIAVLLVGWFLLQLFGPNPTIVVSPQTTYLTAPLAEDGLPDFATYLLDRQRAGLNPEDNAAIPLIQALWPAGLEPEDYDLVCAEMGIPIPGHEGMKELGYQDARNDSLTRAMAVMLLAKREIEPPKKIESAEDFNAWQTDWFAKSELDPQEAYGEFGGVALGEFMDPFSQANDDALQLLSQAECSPWTAAQLSPLADWVERNAHNFDLLHEAAKRPGYYFPSPTLLRDPNASLLSVLLPDVQSMRTAVRYLQRRVTLHVGEKRFAEAWSDCQVMYLLADHTPQETLVGQLVLIACHGIANAAAEQILDQPDLPAEIAQQMHAFYQSRRSRREMHNSVDTGERLMAITSVLQLSGDRAPLEPDSGIDEIQSLGVAAFDWNLVLRGLNTWYDRIEKAMQVVDYNKRQAALATVEDDLMALRPSPGDLAKSIFSRTHRSRTVTDILASLLLPAISAACTAEDRYNADLRLMQVAAALAVYRAEQGEYPNSLDALVPGLLQQLPVDGFTGKPLTYTKTTNGYLLVDCGPDGIDSGGMSETRWLYKGYEVLGDDEPGIRESLGLPPLSKNEEEFGGWAFDDPDADALDQLPLSSQIPTGTDDHALRFPLPAADWSALEAKPSAPASE